MSLALTDSTLQCAIPVFSFTPCQIRSFDTGMLCSSGSSQAHPEQGFLPQLAMHPWEDPANLRLRPLSEGALPGAAAVVEGGIAWAGGVRACALAIG